MSEKRRPIRKKVQRMVLSISLAALVLASAVGLFSMARIQGDSESALIHQMEQNLSNIVTSKAELAESELGQYAGYIGDFARYIHELYRHPAGYAPIEVLPSDEKNSGIYVMQRAFASKDVALDDVQEELCLLGNLEKIWKPVTPERRAVITTVYIGTKSGFMISYDDGSFAVEEGETEDYYNYFESAWYRLAREMGRVCFTDVYMDVYGRGPTITCAAPFYDAKGEFAGVVAMDILISDLYKAVVELELGEGAYAFLLDHKGNAIGPDGIEPDRAAVPDRKQKVFLSNDGVYHAQERIKSTGWTFGIRIPESVILAPVRSVNRTVIITMLLFLAAFTVIVALVFAVARRFSARLTGPIAALKRDVEKISGGNLDYRARIYDNDEVGDLAGSFNDMAASLKEYIRHLAAVTAEKERIGAELNVATQIQADMLPRIFPPFPDRKEFDIYATMTPAKEVGGDFYDFFLIDDDHLAMVMADVSGKGVPAALFMVIAKTLIKNRAQMGGTPSEILGAVNDQLCDGNEAGLFVTVWLGILETATGKVISSNAGHEYPAIKRANGVYELMKTKHSPAVAVREGLQFREAEFELRPGDSLYLYTDGVAEATNAQEELFGTDRMLDALNRHGTEPVDELLASMKREVDAFVGDAPQFDDITMLALRYRGNTNELTVEARTENLREVIAFLDGHLKRHGCPPKTQRKIDVAAEEIFVNIAHYAYTSGAGSVTVRFSVEEGMVVVTFIDSGVPYDPLAKPDPDLTLPTQERPVGGLGIYMVKKSMDSVAYERRDGQNIFTMRKAL